MSRRKKHRADGGFYMTTRQMTRSAAYRSLSPRAGWLLHGLMDLYMGDDNRVAMSVREAGAWLKSGFHQATAAFTELQDKGFIRCYERGGFSRKVAHATVWTLTMFGRGGQKATLDFLSWQPAENPKRGCHPGNSAVANTATVRGSTVAAPATDSPIYGCQYGNSTVATPATLIESTIQGRAAGDGLPLAPTGTREMRAAWLRSWLSSGRISIEAIACALDLEPEHVEEIASGKVALAVSGWRKLAALVAERLH
jgi:hypothetical protein